MTASANLTSVTANYITDSTGGMWTVVPTNTTAGNRVCHNGTVMTNTSNVTQLLYDKNTVYQENTSKNWYKWSGTAWVATTNPLAPPVSASGSTITTVGPSLVDSASNVWTLVSSTSSGLQIALNGVTDTATADVTLLLYYSSTIYQENSFGGWWSWTSGAWVSVSGDPRVVAPTGPTGPTGSGIPAAPAALNGLGYSVVFFDDFTNASTVLGSLVSSPATGVNWYAVDYAQTSPTNYQVLTTTTAAGISNGNSGGGPNPSPSGGIMEVKGISAMTYNANFQSVPTNNTGPNSWKHAYFEGYMQYNINNSSPTGWPAFWSWPDGNSGVEVDFMEVAGPNETPKAAVWSGWTIHDPAGEQGSAVKANGAMQNPVDSSWHTYACWWRSTGTDTGTLDFYFDNTHVGGPITTGPGNTVPDMESATGQFLTLGTGVGIPVYFDWVRVWQA